MKKLFWIAVMTALASPALAHPGHPEALAQGNLHWLTMANHLVVVVLTIALGAVPFVPWQLFSRKREQDEGRVE